MSTDARDRTVYNAHGIRIVSDIPLPALASAGHGQPDMELTWDRSHDPLPDPLPGTGLLRFAVDGRLRYSASDDHDVFHLRFAGCCDFTVARDLRRAYCRPTGAADPALASVLAEGALIAFVLLMAGHCVLHASAVRVGDGAVAVVGPSGTGKSTIAAALCATGCDLITDDVLRVDVDGAPVAHRGTHELRLRPGAHAVADRFDVPVGRRCTADGRLALRPPRSTRPTLPLQAIVLPRPRRHGDHVRLTRVVGSDALSRLQGSSRLIGWRATEVLRPQFAMLAHLARNLPVYEAALPWGPTITSAAAHELRTALHAELCTAAVSV